MPGGDWGRLTPSAYHEDEVREPPGNDPGDRRDREDDHVEDETGAEAMYSVGPEVKRFNDLKVGDIVKMTWTDEVDPFSSSGSLARRQSPRQERRRSHEYGRAAGRDHGDAGHDDGDRQGHRSGCAVRNGDYRRWTHRDPQDRGQDGPRPHQVGDRVGITYTRALLTNIERGK